MADENFLKKVHDLSDLELAALLCLVSREHCLISTPPDALDDLVEELQLISTKVFGLKSVVVDCTSETTLNDFATSLLLSPPPTAPKTRSPSPLTTRQSQQQQQHQHQQHNEPQFSTPSYFVPQHGSGGQNHHHHHPHSLPLSPLSPGPGSQASQIANVVLARNLDAAPKAVQIQALELLRSKRIFTRTSVHTAPRRFLLVGVLGAASGGQARVTPHLNDMFYLAHWHDPEDGFVNLEEREDGGGYGAGVDDGNDNDDDDDVETASTASVVKRSRYGDADMGEAVFSEGDIACLAKLSQQAHLDVDVLRYQMNIISFLRMHRAVAGGITPTASRHFEQLMKCLAPLHRLDYVTPSLVALAAKKVYLHRISIVVAEKERSVQWGSDLSAVQTLLADIGAEDVIEDVLGMVGVPV